MSTTFTAPTRTRSAQSPTKHPAAEPRRRSFTEQRRAARRMAADRSLRAQLVKGRTLVQLMVSSGGKESRWPFVAAFALIAGISVVALLMVNTATAQTSFTEQRLSDELHELTLAEQQLRQEVAAKQAPEQLAVNAQELGMQPGSNPGNLVINPDGSVTWIEPSAPSAPPAPPAPDQAAAPGAGQPAADAAAAPPAAEQAAAPTDPPAAAPTDPPPIDPPPADPASAPQPVPAPGA